MDQQKPDVARVQGGLPVSSMLVEAVAHYGRVLRRCFQHSFQAIRLAAGAHPDAVATFQALAAARVIGGGSGSLGLVLWIASLFH